MGLTNVKKSKVIALACGLNTDEEFPDYYSDFDACFDAMRMLGVRPRLSPFTNLVCSTDESGVVEGLAESLYLFVSRQNEET